MKTYFPTPNDRSQAGWHVVDADGQTLGRLASRVATILRGKDKPDYTPGVDNGDFVIVINAAKVRVTGRKETQKIYYRHTGYPGGLRQTTLQQMRAKHPERIIELAVRGMLPSTAQGKRMLRKLKVYAGPDHPHEAQQPEPLSLS